MQTNLRTHEGAPAFMADPLSNLKRVLNAHMLYEGSFYLNGKEAGEMLLDAVEHAEKRDTVATYSIISNARHEHNIRHASLAAAVQFAKIVKGRVSADLIRDVISRVDELGEVLAMAGGKNAPHCVMSGVARAFRKFDEYQFGKYQGTGKGISLKDAVFLSHPNPIDTPLVQKIVDGTLATPDTWETRLSAKAETKCEVFTDLLQSNKLGAMALLRNLRGMSEAGVDHGLISAALVHANWSKVLPFRFMTAALHAPMFAERLDEAFRKAVAGSVYLKGRTAVLVDTSGSMSHTLSDKSVVQLNWAGACLAAAINGDTVRLFEWASSTAEVANFRSLSTAMGLQTGRCGHSTDLGQAMKYVYRHAGADFDRYIVISDMQFKGGYSGAGDRYRDIEVPSLPEGAKGYTINVGRHNNPGIIGGDWTHFTGFSPAVLGYIAEVEG